MIADLKQFMIAFLRQELAYVARKSDIDSLTSNVDDLRNEIVRLDKKIDDRADEIMGAIGETMAADTDATDEQFTGFDRRLTSLEAKAA